MEKLRMNGSMSAGTGAVAITGATGLVGSALSDSLAADGTRIVRLSRRPGPDTVVWDPAGELTDVQPLEGLAAVVHLAGENIGGKRWSTAQKQKLRDSRIEGTRNLCRSLARLSAPPQVLICASAIGFYGDRGDTLLDESSPAGTGFLADLCRDWEAAADEALKSGIRVVKARFGVVLSKDGGALQKMLFPFKMGGGGRIGSGRQYWSWVALPDVIGALRYAMATPSLTGAVNVVSPDPATNAGFTKTLANVLHRPAVIPMPATLARLALGEMADELLLASARVVPRKLQSSGFVFQYSDLELALRDALN
jgi:uncharacterized protein (TIGR01777 family)